MVQVASLRIQIEAQQARTEAQAVRRELDAVAVSGEKAAVSTDKLERQLAELTQITRRVAANTHASAVAVQRFGVNQQTTGVAVERTTERIVRQERAGFRLSAMFGGLAARTAATGGAFLAADFLARVAGANSLFDLMSKGLDKVAAAFRDIFTEAKSFNDILKEIAAQKPLDDAGLAGLLTQAGTKGRAVVSATFPGTNIPLTVPKLAGENQTLAGGIAKELAEFEEDINAARATRDRILASGDFNASRVALERTRQFEVFRAGQAQQDIDRLAAFFEAMPADAARGADAVESFNAAVKRTSYVESEFRKGVRRMEGERRFRNLGLSVAIPAAIGGIDAGQRYMQAQGFANQRVTGDGGDVGGNVWMNNLVTASAKYASNLAKIVDGQQKAAQSAKQFGESAASAFEDAFFNARSLGEGLEMLSRSIVRIIFNQLVTQNLAASLGELFGPVASAKGNVFSNGNVVPFAYGGIISGPVMFPLGGNKTGLAGEAGPEAIVPLGRNAKGELGVKGGHTVNVYISTPDVAGFNRSRHQIAQDMRRALR